MGLLSPKERVLDTIITQIGRQQIATGKLKAEYVSFSDMGAIYRLDTIVSGGLDQTYRLCFEANSLPQDLIVFEADDSGKLLATYRSGSLSVSISSGQILSGSTRDERVSLSGSQFASLAEKVLDSNLDNFQKQYILASPDPIDERYDQFLIGPKDARFVISEERPIDDDSLKEINIDHVESLFFDKRLSHLPNFQFLPPINKPRIGESQGSSLGLYVNLNQEALLSYSDVVKEINTFEERGYSQDIRFVETSKTNNLLGQFFEIDEKEVTKLDVIDFGKFPPDEFGVIRHVFFVGKVFIDGMGSTTYCNMFTLIFES
jgi:hypothetical protein